MTLLTTEHPFFTSANNAVCESLAVDTVVASVATEMTTTDVDSTIVTGTSLTATTLNATTMSVTNSVATSLTADNVNATDASFFNLPTCIPQPTAANELANKAYVDAAAGGGGGGGGGIETVTGTGAISNSVETTLLSGTTHTLPAGTTIGATKIIVNMNPSAITPAAALGIQTTALSSAAVNAIAVDAVNQRVFITGSFGQVNQLANTGKIAYYDLNTSTWNAMSTGANTANSDSGLCLLVDGNRVYNGGLLQSNNNVTPTWGGLFMDRIAYFDFNTGVWNALAGDIIPSGQNSAQVTNIRKLNGTIYIMGLLQFNNPNYYRGIWSYDPGANTYSHLPPGSNGNSGPYNPGDLTSITGVQVRDAVSIGTKIYVIGNFPRVRNAGVDVANTQFLAAYNLDTLLWEAVGTATFNQQINSIIAYDGKLILQGNFTLYGTVQMTACAQWDPVNQIMSQFAPPSSPSLSSVNFYVDPVTNDLWCGQNGSNYANSTIDPFLPGASKGQLCNGLARYNASTNVWEPLTQSSVSSIARLPLPLPAVKYFLGTTNVGGTDSLFDSVVLGADGLVQLDMTKRQIVTTAGSFSHNSTTWQNFNFLYAYQSIMLLNVDNTNWVVTADNNTAMTPASAAPILFF